MDLISIFKKSPFFALDWSSPNKEMGGGTVLAFRVTMEVCWGLEKMGGMIDHPPMWCEFTMHCALRQRSRGDEGRRNGRQKKEEVFTKMKLVKL